MWNRLFFRQIDNSALIVFRIIFGLLIFLESIGAIFTGWIKRTLIEPDFTFTVIGFEWLQPLPGNGMYIYYIIMGLFSLGVMLGYKYRLSIIAFTVLWTGTYLMQKASYNNHYYLLILLSVFMCLMPAHKHTSIDAHLNPTIRSIKMPHWCRWVFIVQMAIVYSYAAINKMYPDWLDTTVIKQLMLAKQHYYFIGDALQHPMLHYFIAYGGILYDGLVIPLILFKPTRKIAIACSFIFHLFNAIVFQVGIFPFLSLAFILFFVNPQQVHRLFLKQKKYYSNHEIITPNHAAFFKPIIISYFIIQILLPLRHWCIPGDVLATEEGHRLSWRMMLRTKYGVIRFKVVDEASGTSEIINLQKYLSKKQEKMIATKPDVIWQFVQRLKREYAQQGKDVAIYAIYSRISINGKPLQNFVNPAIDLAQVDWSPYTTAHWLLP